VVTQAELIYSMKENLVDIMCIGVQKGSTSWLHHVINSHPKVQAFENTAGTSTNKEAHFWDWNHTKGIDWYKKLMEVPEDKLSLDFTPEYAFMSEDKIKQCKQLSHDCKVIYVLREPVCRAISSIRMYVLRDKGEESDYQLSYNEYFKTAIDKAKIMAHSEYYKNYLRWKKYYPVKIINYEDILNSKQEVMNDVFNYLDLSFDDYNEENKTEFDKRMEKIVWKSKNFEFNRDCLMYLDGLLSKNRRYFEKFFEINFEEHQKIGLI